MPSSLKQQEFDRQLDLTQIRQFRNSGDLEILGTLYEKYMHLVYGVGLKYFKNRDQASEIVMQVFEKLTVEAGKQEITNFRSWLYVVAKNQCLMELRKLNAEDNRFRLWQAEEKRIMESGFELHPLDDSQRLSDALQDCITKLIDEQKSSIDLFYFKKKSYQEISILLKIEEKKVKSSIQNGKRNLKICLESSNG
ncbi:MAG: sigma-70 family RNA polymerase sigma factor [Prolixibacteraceae bacterium]|jgi:RNA polymerase sigma-70 factor (ECF subfamily)|nr:sigma-70 family RNA polymerase sigma factor [Prolixibacteraceae bacterium]